MEFIFTPITFIIGFIVLHLRYRDKTKRSLIYHDEFLKSYSNAGAYYITKSFGALLLILIGIGMIIIIYSAIKHYILA